MDTVELISNGRQLSIEICETWDFVRDMHSFQTHVVDKAAMQRHIIGRYKTRDIAERKAREWINKEMSQ